MREYSVSLAIKKLSKHLAILKLMEDLLSADQDGTHVHTASSLSNCLYYNDSMNLKPSKHGNELHSVILETYSNTTVLSQQCFNPM